MTNHTSRQMILGNSPGNKIRENCIYTHLRDHVLKFISLNVRKKLRLSNERVRIVTFSSNERIPGHIRKASAVVAVVAQAVWVCIPHTAGLVLVDNWDTEVLDHSGRGLEIIKM